MGPWSRVAACAPHDFECSRFHTGGCARPRTFATNRRRTLIEMAMVGNGIPRYSPAGTACRCADLLCGRGRSALRLSQRYDLGPSRPDADRIEHRRAVWCQSDLGDQRSRATPLHADGGPGNRRDICRVSQAIADQRTAPIFVIVDGHPTHRAKSVSQFVAAQQGLLVLFHLPPYSPELNPDELVWNDLKTHGTGRKLITSPTQLRQTVISHMRQLQKLPNLVRSFFHAPTTQYARL